MIQHAKKKSITLYVAEFKDALREAVLYVRDEKIRHNIDRVLNIWQERNIYPSEFVDELRSVLTGVSAQTARASKIVAEFDLTNVIDKIKHLKKLETSTKKRIECVNEARIDKLSKEVLNNLKDKSNAEQFSKDFEEATKHIEAAVSALEKEILVRKDLIQSLEKTEIYYETQKGEAKILANAYKNFAQRVRIVKKKLSESKDQLPSPLPSPCADAPSPTNSDDGPQLPGSESPRQNGKESSLDKRLSSLLQGIPLVPSEASLNQPNEVSYGQNVPISLNPSISTNMGMNSSTDSWVSSFISFPSSFHITTSC